MARGSVKAHYVAERKERSEDSLTKDHVSAVSHHDAELTIIAAPRVRLQHEGLTPEQTHGCFPFAHILPHRRFRHLHCGHLATQSCPNPVRGVPLLPVHLAVRLQDPVDKWNCRRQLRPLPVRNLPVSWHRTGQCLPHFSTVYAQLPRHCPYGSGTMFVLSPDLLV